jgi:hypothetical protein
MRFFIEISCHAKKLGDFFVLKPVHFYKGIANKTIIKNIKSIKTKREKLKEGVLI